MHHISKQLRAFSNLPYFVSGNDVSSQSVMWDNGFVIIVYISHITWLIFFHV